MAEQNIGNNPPRMNDLELQEAIRKLIFSKNLHKWGLPLQDESALQGSENFLLHNVPNFCAGAIECGGGSAEAIIKSALEFVFAPQMLRRLKFGRREKTDPRNTLFLPQYRMLCAVLHLATVKKLKAIGQTIRADIYDELLTDALEELKIYHWEHLDEQDREKEEEDDEFDF